MARSKARESTALVVGCDVVPSAIAYALRTRGWDVVMIDDIDPPGPWRGMSFVNAWYLGSAELLNVAACFCASVKSIPSVLHRHNMIAATSWAWQGVAVALLPEVVIDARSVADRACDNLRARAPAGVVTVGCGTGFVAGQHVDLAVPERFDAVASAGHVLRAPRHGRMRSVFRVGDRIESGEPIGDVNGAALIAPVAGVLRGLTARGARVAASQIVVDIDPRGDPGSCYGVEPNAARIAASVVRVLEDANLLRGTAAESSHAALT